jgi:NAD(P)-dependent dehydrogenase (short-subunit alcohol dehydrogenase family)
MKLQGASMKNKTLFITGGNDGIGLATAIAFAEQGANIAIFSRRPEKNAAAKAKIEALGARCIVIAGDVVSESDIANAVKQTVDTFGGLHFAFNNAGITGNPAPFATTSVEEYDRIIGTNLKGVWLAMKHELPAIVASGGGAIVNTGSMASAVGMPMLPIYNASKHAVLGLTKSAALEYAKQGVRVNAVCPGTTADTGIYEDISRNAPQIETALVTMVPMGRLCKPKEIAGSVLYLCSDAASYVTGQALYVDGGFTVP